MENVKPLGWEIRPGLIANKAEKEYSAITCDMRKSKLMNLFDALDGIPDEVSEGISVWRCWKLS